jgi:hypothetical protein
MFQKSANNTEEKNNYISSSYSILLSYEKLSAIYIQTF